MSSYIKLVSQTSSRYLKKYFETSELLLKSVDTLCLCKSYKGIPSTPWKWDFFNSEIDEDHVKVLITNVKYSKL